jgi:DNA ligase-1
VPVAKAYSGLSNEEIRQVDRFIRDHTRARHGPVHVVEPALVFELGFENIQPSSRHKAGLALRFPRMLRQRPDKQPAEADALASLHALLAEVHPSTR